MSSVSRTSADKREASGRSPAAGEFETVRGIYDAMYRGEIDEKRVVELLSDLEKRSFPWHVRVLSRLSRQ